MTQLTGTLQDIREHYSDVLMQRCVHTFREIFDQDTYHPVQVWNFYFNIPHKRVLIYYLESMQNNSSVIPVFLPFCFWFIANGWTRDY